MGNYRYNWEYVYYLRNELQHYSKELKRFLDLHDLTSDEKKDREYMESLIDNFYNS